MAGIKSYPPTSATLQLILDQIHQKNPIIALMLEFSAKTGISYNDCTAIQLEQIIFNDEVVDEIEITPQRSYHKRLAWGVEPCAAEEDSSLIVPINLDVADIVYDCRAILNLETGLLFSSLKSHDSSYTIQYANQILKKVAMNLELDYKLTTNSFRQYFAKSLIQNGCTKQELSIRLGHSRMVTTERFLRTFLDESDLFFK